MATVIATGCSVTDTTTATILSSVSLTATLYTPCAYANCGNFCPTDGLTVGDSNRVPETTTGDYSVVLTSIFATLPTASGRIHVNTPGAFPTNSASSSSLSKREAPQNSEDGGDRSLNLLSNQVILNNQSPLYTISLSQEIERERFWLAIWGPRVVGLYYST